MRSKEELKDIRNAISWTNIGLEKIDIIERDLEVLEIVKNKRVNWFVLCDIPSVKNVNDYNNYMMTEEEYLSVTEFDFLKEWLNDESK
ncbi:MAG: hypothetical protein J6S67_05425 [Methanobrevibacter sp.]|nr:hypothetical protein [Methanobrevibacter sp.]